jgi:hypothetical protein
MDFEKLYQNTSDSVKLKFLDALIIQNRPMQVEFTNYTRGMENAPKVLTYSDFIKIISETESDYREEFESVDPENPDWDNYHPPHSGYIKDWEAYQYANEQELEAFFEIFRTEALNLIIQQRPDKLAAQLIGLYEAALNAEIEDEVGSFEDVSDFLLTEHNNSLEKLIDKLRLSALPETAIGSAFDLFIQYQTNEYPGNPGFAAHFEPLLLALAEKAANPARLLEILRHTDLNNDLFPELLLQLNKKTGNADEWLSIAKRLYKQNHAVAKELLLYYFETDKQTFADTARELFPDNKKMWAEFLLPYITPELDKDLFVQVYLKLTDYNRDIELYGKVRDHLSPNDFKQLLESIRWNKVFMVNILAVEELYDDIKSIVEKNNNYQDFTEIIAPILNVYPEFCFRKIEDITRNTLLYERSRYIYTQIASWLKLAEVIPGFEAECQRLIQQTYTHKPNLPALKDEMRKAGLVKG